MLRSDLTLVVSWPHCSIRQTAEWTLFPVLIRRAGGFSQGFVGRDSVFYSAGFAGSYDEMRRIAHERMRFIANS